MFGEVPIHTEVLFKRYEYVLERRGDRERGVVGGGLNDEVKQTSRRVVDEVLVKH